MFAIKPYRRRSFDLDDLIAPARHGQHVARDFRQAAVWIGSRGRPWALGSARMASQYASGRRPAGPTAAPVEVSRPAASSAEFLRAAYRLESSFGAACGNAAADVVGRIDARAIEICSDSAGGAKSGRSGNVAI
jgi:hypothetical protein